VNIPGRAYLVGGAVRDGLLGRPVGDRDWVVVGASSEAMLAAGFTQVGRDFPVFLHPESHEEYALARTERKTGQGHVGFVCHAGPEVTLEEDLLRRDLTINAIAQEVDGTLVDPYGGQQDLARRLLRHVSNAFNEDPLRILRVARFRAQLGFDVAPDTLQVMGAMAASGALDELPPERVWQEFGKALRFPAAASFVDTLREITALRPWFVECEPLATGVSLVGTTSLQRFGSLSELLGGEQMQALGRRLLAPGRYLRMASAVGQFGGHLSRWRQTPPAELLRILQSLGVLQKGANNRLIDFDELLELLTKLYEDGNQIGDGARLRQLTRDLSGIGAAAVANENLRGPELGAAIAQLRVLEIARAQEG